MQLADGRALGHEGHRAQVDRTHHVGQLVVGRHHHHRQRRVALAQIVQQRKAVHTVGQQGVQQHQVDAVVLRQLRKGLVGAVGRAPHHPGVPHVGDVGQRKNPQGAVV